MGCVRVTMLLTPEGWALCSAEQWRRAELLPRHGAPNACLRPLWSHVFREHGKVSWWCGQGGAGDSTGQVGPVGTESSFSDCTGWYIDIC